MARIEISDLTKKFGSLTALDEVTVSLDDYTAIVTEIPAEYALAS